MSEQQAVKPSLPMWLIEEEKKTEEAIRHIERLVGSFDAERNVTLFYLRGYLTALRVISRREDF